ncbi:MAG: penicillin-binding protein activator [Candidatus Desulfofervidus auxilii]|nr:penicillin-binding protein activator [Candidatus Desulfofervidus auxilii]
MRIFPKIILFFLVFSFGFDFFNFRTKYHLACLLPLNGEKKIIAQDTLKGLLLGLEIFKKDSNFILSIYDTEGNPMAVTQALEKIAKDDYEMVIALLGKKTTLPAVIKARTLGIPLIILSSEENLPLGDGIYRDFITPKIQIENLLNFVMAELGLSTFVIFCPKDTYGQKFSRLFKEEVEKKGGEIKAIITYLPGTTDFGPQIKKLIGKEIAEAKPETLLEKPPKLPFEAVFIPDIYLNSAFIISQFAYYNVRDLIFLGTTLWGHPKFAQMIKGNCQAAYFPTGFTLQARQPWVQEFIAEFRKTYKIFPNYLSAQGYEVGRILVYLKSLKNLHLENAYEAIQNFPGVTGLTSFLSNGEVKKKIYIMEISNGIVNLVY